MTLKKTYRERLQIPIDFGDCITRFYTRCGTHIATGYKRIVIGARGPYIEFEESNIIRESICIPENEMWRLQSNVSYYVEYRTNDICNIKIYFQKKTVNYADYKLDFYYISPFDLKTDAIDNIIIPLRQLPSFDSNFF